MLTFGPRGADHERSHSGAEHDERRALDEEPYPRAVVDEQPAEIVEHVEGCGGRRLGSNTEGGLEAKGPEEGRLDDGQGDSHGDQPAAVQKPRRRQAHACSRPTIRWSAVKCTVPAYPLGLVRPIGGAGRRGMPRPLEPSAPRT